eukprot:TRINITY_DN11751_c0_g1_i1.p1 TRINITY_DN11751_c0_g1~~TRINITY_DN11751_c0_g1_i1.p1  ORF type:complete len:873 (+),score=182.78 TRINITY_DN11751_c0_g1_i1:92-2710(+)
MLRVPHELLDLKARRTGSEENPEIAGEPVAKPPSGPTPFSQSVDDLETALGAALREYRLRAEDALAQHLETAAKLEAAHQLELAKLRAENAMLRDALGVNGAGTAGGSPKLFQEVAMLENEENLGSSKKSQNQMANSMQNRKSKFVSHQAGRQTFFAPGASDKALDARRFHQKNQQSAVSMQAGGTWQQFVAWVPNGAALKTAEPWRPLPMFDSAQAASPTSNLFTINKKGRGRPPSGKSDEDGMAMVATKTDSDCFRPRVSLAASLTSPVLTLTLPGAAVDNKDENPKQLRCSVSASRRGSTSRRASSSSVASSMWSGGDSDDDDSHSSQSDFWNEAYRFDVLECWQVSKQKLAKMRKTHGAQENHSRLSGMTADAYNSFVSESDQVFSVVDSHGCLVIHPHSNVRIAWDVASLLVVVHDMIMIPMSVFDLPDQNLFLQAIAWSDRLFWTTDMGWSCCTGLVLKDGTVKLQFGDIIRHYMRTWFAMDFFIVGTDWAQLVLSEAGEVGGMGRFVRAFRVVRIARLLRLVRMKEVMNNITERIQSEGLAFILSILKLLVAVIGLSHAIACGWWSIGKSVNANSWVNRLDYGHEALGNQYLLSMHWSLTQFSGGMDEIRPVRPMERLYCVFVWITTFLCAGLVVSILTSNLTQLHIIGGTHSRQLSTLRKYLQQNNISSNLALRLQRSAQHAVSGELAPDAVDLLPVVSEPLKVAMHFEMFSPVLKHHPFFADCIMEGPQVMRRVCHCATSTLLLSQGDVIFSKGETTPEPKMYFVCKGMLEYAHPSGDLVTLVDRQWVAEPTLWTIWRHRGTLTALDDAKIFMLDSTTFQNVVARGIRLKEEGIFDPKLYAADFVAHLNSVDDPNDLSCLTSL